ncbi:hypothetical protein PVAP13_2NG358309 [Panicum virgatum]|uniref:Uncharacterized protein n=1 Tax=Panicum virgatum TaxID=38727 RepID=A0A8T0VKW7_PANVG|nr:hypothetical protein PVAP13_2NG358309 [Panicum virgatum]
MPPIQAASSQRYNGRVRLAASPTSVSGHPAPQARPPRGQHLRRSLDPEQRARGAVGMASPRRRREDLDEGSRRTHGGRGQYSSPATTQPPPTALATPGIFAEHPRARCISHPGSFCKLRIKYLQKSSWFESPSDLGAVCKPRHASYGTATGVVASESAATAWRESQYEKAVAAKNKLSTKYQPW